MENLTPPLLEAVRELRWRIASGHSMREALRQYLTFATHPFAQKLREWWAFQSTQDRKAGAPPVGSAKKLFPTTLQRALVELIERGLQGQPVLEHLTALEEETETAAQAELDVHVGALPFKVLVPLLLFQFPAYLILLLGPMLRELSEKMGAR